MKRVVKEGGVSDGNVNRASRVQFKKKNKKHHQTPSLVRKRSDKPIIIF